MMGLARNTPASNGGISKASAAYLNIDTER